MILCIQTTEVAHNVAHYIKKELISFIYKMPVKEREHSGAKLYRKPLIGNWVSTLAPSFSLDYIDQGRGDNLRSKW